MSICKLNSNLLRSAQCGYNLPDIVDIYLINYGDGKAEVTGSTGGCESITGFTWTDSGSTPVFHVEPVKNSASYSDELVVEDGGIKYRTSTVTFNVAGDFTACQKAALDQLSLGRYFVACHLANDTYIGFGRFIPLEASVATIQFGQNGGNTFQVTLTANMAESAFPLSEAAVTELLSKVAPNS